MNAIETSLLSLGQHHSSEVLMEARKPQVVPLNLRISRQDDQQVLGAHMGLEVYNCHETQKATTLKGSHLSP